MGGGCARVGGCVRAERGGVRGKRRPSRRERARRKHTPSNGTLRRELCSRWPKYAVSCPLLMKLCPASRTTPLSDGLSYSGLACVSSTTRAGAGDGCFSSSGGGVHLGGFCSLASDDMAWRRRRIVSRWCGGRKGAEAWSGVREGHVGWGTELRAELRAAAEACKSIPMLGLALACEGKENPGLKGRGGWAHWTRAELPASMDRETDGNSLRGVVAWRAHHETRQRCRRTTDTDRGVPVRPDRRACKLAAPAHALQVKSSTTRHACQYVVRQSKHTDAT